MSEPEKFLERWSKRKLANADAAAPQQKEIAPPTETENDSAAPVARGDASNAPAAKTEDKPFDIASLPSIESIGADTDVTAFLRPGVPADLTRAALRRAWSSDPAIRDFVGLVENGWDFNDPNAMAGFGPIGADEAARLLAQAMGELPELAKKVLAQLPEETALREGEEQPSVTSRSTEPGGDNSDGSPDAAEVRCNINNDAAQKESGS